jgi:hypothetical protein
MCAAAPARFAPGHRRDGFPVPQEYKLYGKGTDAYQLKVQVANFIVSNSDSSSLVDVYI